MKKTIILLIFTAIIFNACEDKTKLTVDMVAKDPKEKKFTPKTFDLTSLSKKQIKITTSKNGAKIDNYTGKKAVLIDVFATWCPPCIEEIPTLNKLREKYKNDFEIVSVLFERDKEKSKIIEFKNKHKILYPITIGSENFKLAKEFGDIQKVPEMFLFGKDGRFIKKFVGATSEENLEKYIKMAIK